MQKYEVISAAPGAELIFATLLLFCKFVVLETSNQLGRFGD
jgi:hypothetical protein